MHIHVRSVIYEKNEKWILLKGDGMVTELYWMVSEWSLKCTCHSVDWTVTERWPNGAFQASRNGAVLSCGNLMYYLSGWGEVRIYKYWLHERVTWEIVIPRKPMLTEAKPRLTLVFEERQFPKSPSRAVNNYYNILNVN